VLRCVCVACMEFIAWYQHAAESPKRVARSPFVARSIRCWRLYVERAGLEMATRSLEKVMEEERFDAQP
jgi:hypothetical protein